jgi:hypothetical protein
MHNATFWPSDMHTSQARFCGIKNPSVVHHQNYP